jgi:hypothetical protein
MDAGLGPIEEEKETKMSWSVVDMWHVVDDPWRSTRWRPARGGCGASPAAACSCASRRRTWFRDRGHAYAEGSGRAGGQGRWMCSRWLGRAGTGS